MGFCRSGSKLFFPFCLQPLRKNWTPGFLICQALYVYFNMPSPQKRKALSAHAFTLRRIVTLKIDGRILRKWFLAQLTMKINFTPKR